MTEPPVTTNVSSISRATDGSLPVTTAERNLQQTKADRALDQWRGLALILVLISHAFFTTGLVPGLGRAGVNLFFFISGILVFRSLARGPQEIWAGFKYFAVRRIKRLVPAKYVYLLCMCALVLMAWPIPISSAFRESFLDGLPSSFLYYRNYHTRSILGINENLTGHLWSLGCELQFYLLAPFIFFAGGKSILRRSMVFGTILTVLLISGFAVFLKKTPYHPYTFGVAAWPMMAGFFIEFLRSTFPNKCVPWGKFLIVCGALSLLAMIPAAMMAHKKALVLTGTLLIAGCLGCYLKGVAPGGFVGDACHYLGNRTYSIYLWQQPLTIGGWMPSVFHPLGSLLAIVVGIVSFRYLEQPFMSKFKTKKA